MAVCCILVRFDDMPGKKSGIRTQESGVAGVQETIRRGCLIIRRAEAAVPFCNFSEA